MNPPKTRSMKQCSQATNQPIHESIKQSLSLLDVHEGLFLLLRYLRATIGVFSSPDLVDAWLDMYSHQPLSTIMNQSPISTTANTGLSIAMVPKKVVVSPWLSLHGQSRYLTMDKPTWTIPHHCPFTFPTFL